jgi:hypothetical protein
VPVADVHVLHDPGAGRQGPGAQPQQCRAPPRPRSRSSEHHPARPPPTKAGGVVNGPVNTRGANRRGRMRRHRWIRTIDAGQGVDEAAWNALWDTPRPLHTEEVTGSIPVSPTAGQRPGSRSSNQASVVCTAAKYSYAARRLLTAAPLPQARCTTGGPSKEVAARPAHAVVVWVTRQTSAPGHASDLECMQPVGRQCAPAKRIDGGIA